MSKKLGGHLTSNAREINSYTLLKRVFWLFARSYRVSLGQWTKNINEYSANPLNVERQTRDGRTQSSTNLVDSLTGERISFLQLMRGFKVLKIVRFRITFEVWKEGEEKEPPKVVVVDERMSNMITRNAGRDSNI